MKKAIVILVFGLLWCNVGFADEKPGRFFEDQPDVTDGHQIHFIYLLGKDSKDKELDINGFIEKEVKKMNQVMLEQSAKHKNQEALEKNIN